MIRQQTRRAHDFEGVEAVLAEAVEALAPRLAGLMASRAAPPRRDVVVEIVIGGAAQAAHYGAPAEAVGFFAVASEMRFDPGVRDPRKGWHEIAEGFEVHVNVEAFAARLAAKWAFDDDFGRACEIEAALATLPHEMIHALDWIDRTGGRTPLEVYDEGPGALALRRTLAAIEKRPGCSEEAVEDLARSWTARSLVADEVYAWVERLAALMPGSAPAP